MPIAEVTAVGIDVSFGDRRVLHSISGTFTGGRLTAVMGPSGSGKSTLLGVLAGLITPDRGTVDVRIFDGQPLSLAWILQSAPVLARRSALDNVALGPLSRGESTSAAHGCALAAMRRLGVEAFADTPVYRMSGGERQRIVVARAIATQAHIVLADEPTAALDAGNRSLVCDALVAAAQAGSAVVVATHDQAVAARCDDILDLALHALALDAP